MDNIGLTGIIPANHFKAIKKQRGSSFLRAEELVNNADDFEIWKHGKEYNNLIFQKTYWKEMIELFKGPKILDLCDPDWIKERVNIIEIGNLVQAITCSSEKLRDQIQHYFPNKLIVYIPDRFNFKLFPSPRGLHNDKAKKVVWFGYIDNAYETLGSLLATIQKHDLTLKIISNRAYINDIVKQIKIEFVEYKQETAYWEIKDADIVLNPKSEKAFYKYKSNNKSIIGWKLGLPVAENSKELEKFINPEIRNNEVFLKQKYIDIEYDILKSIEQYREIIKLIR